MQFSFLVHFFISEGFRYINIDIFIGRVLVGFSMRGESQFLMAFLFWCALKALKLVHTKFCDAGSTTKIISEVIILDFIVIWILIFHLNFKIFK